ncbi:hypothetical protein NPIL_398991 [Nephila pilipes]|uniref:Uncharacterized protein n=1 Tax=Nephila pilipes TaxID=299642 RepID=A0A8X6R709_NEPPI|nr:hypothetical protein NPIL_398991 [Nephila pilipes]
MDGSSIIRPTHFSSQMKTLATPHYRAKLAGLVFWKTVPWSSTSRRGQSFRENNVIISSPPAIIHHFRPVGPPVSYSPSAFSG